MVMNDLKLDKKDKEPKFKYTKILLAKRKANISQAPRKLGTGLSAVELIDSSKARGSGLVNKSAGKDGRGTGFSKIQERRNKSLQAIV